MTYKAKGTKASQEFFDAITAYKLPHLLDRPGQQDAMDWILNSDKQYNFLCAPTGFGKSPLAAAASIEFRTMALVLHKSLQSANYRDQYNFDILYGKSNYPCEEKNKKQSMQMAMFDAPKFTADDCNRPYCDCPYQRQYKACLESQRVSLNYAKFLASKTFCTNLFLPYDDETRLDRDSFDEKYYDEDEEKYSQEFKPWLTYLFLDEAHNLPDVITNYIGVTLDWDSEFLQLIGNIKPETAGRLDYNIARGLFAQYARSVQDNKPEQDIDLAKWRRWKRLYTKIQVTSNMLGNPKDWYYEATDKSLIIKPLTAKYHFKRLFGVADKVVLMSATIKPSIAERLGLEDSEWDYHEVPNPWPVPTRLIYDLGGPVTSYKQMKENPKEFEKNQQEKARLIASVLDERKDGIIHVMSKSQAHELQQRLYLAASDLDVDFHIPTIGMGTEEQYQEWREVCEPGVYCISWNFWEGVDLGFNDISIIAKTPYASLSGNYNQARKDYDQQWYLEKAAMKFQQACGRTQRGIKEHYNGSKKIYIADSSWHRLKTLLSDDFLRSIRRYNK
jgi:Rad3-related DNA helicase